MCGSNGRDSRETQQLQTQLQSSGQSPQWFDGCHADPDDRRPLSPGKRTDTNQFHIESRVVSTNVRDDLGDVLNSGSLGIAEELERQMQWCGDAADWPTQVGQFVKDRLQRIDGKVDGNERANAVGHVAPR